MQPVGNYDAHQSVGDNGTVYFYYGANAGRAAMASMLAQNATLAVAAAETPEAKLAATGGRVLPAIPIALGAAALAPAVVSLGTGLVSSGASLAGLITEESPTIISTFSFSVQNDLGVPIAPYDQENEGCSVDAFCRTMSPGGGSEALISQPNGFDDDAAIKFFTKVSGVPQTGGGSSVKNTTCEIRYKMQSDDWRPRIRIEGSDSTSNSDGGLTVISYIPSADASNEGAVAFAIAAPTIQKSTGAGWFRFMAPSVVID